MKNGKPVIERKQFLVDQMITERIQDRATNPGLDNNAFNFIPPKGAIERHLDKSLGK
jgi:outer membrane lipoprotein-sorting protein